MQQWNTATIKSILETEVPEYQYEVGTFGGDYDTNAIHVKIGKEYLCDIQGWNLKGITGMNHDDHDIDYLAVNTGRYGLENAEPDDLMAVAKITKALSVAGYDITNSGWKNWF